MSKSIFIDILRERGFINQCTDLEALDEYVSEAAKRKEKLVAYIGFDLTAPSLHVGSLIQIMVLRWMVHCRHEPIILLGTFTTMIGDPTGKTSARPMLTKEEIEKNYTGIQNVIGWITGLDPNYEGEMNYKENWWFEDFEFLDFMRTYGKHISVNRMLALDAVKSRIDGNGLSLMEFIYPTMQAVDFVKLNELFGVKLQIGGSDQWGNITAGTDLVRRVNDDQVWGLTTPLFTNSAGQKMGKTANGAVWLDPSLTSIRDFWQFWRNIEDDKVEQCLKLFTELDLADIETLMAGDINAAKITLATHVTDIVHGEGEGKIYAAAPMTLPVASFAPVGDFTLAEVLVSVGLAKSKGDADRLAANGGVKLNGAKVPDARTKFAPISQTLVLSVGKRGFNVQVEPQSQ